MEAYDLVADANWCGNQSHPATASDHWAKFGVQGETSLMFDGMCSQPFHRSARLLAIEGNSLSAANRCTSRQSEDVINSARPDQRIIREVAFPAANMLDPEASHFAWFDDVGHGTIQDVAQLKMARLFIERPAVMERERLGRLQFQSPTLYYENPTLIAVQYRLT